MVGQPPWRAAFRRDDIHAQVAIVIAGKGNPAAVRREHGVEFLAFLRGQALRVLTVPGCTPQVPGVHKGYLIGADGGLFQQQGFTGSMCE